jgi:hypothetical protein
MVLSAQHILGNLFKSMHFPAVLSERSSSEKNRVAQEAL